MPNPEIILRKAAQTDIALLLRFKLDFQDHHHRFLSLNIHDQERWFQSLDTNPLHPQNLYLIASHHQQDVGCMGLTDINYINRTAEINCNILKDAQGQGLGTGMLAAGINYAKKLNLRKLSCEILAPNIASIKMVTKNGFVQEGNKKQQVYKNGNYVDSLVFGLLF